MPIRRPTPLMTAVALIPLVASLMSPVSDAGAIITSYAVTSRVSVSTAGAQAAAGHDTDGRVLVDGSGRYVFFSTSAPLEADDTNDAFDVYVRDRLASTTTRVSVTDAGKQITGHSHMCGISHDGRFVGFTSTGSNMPGGATGQMELRDRLTRHTTVVSLSSGGAEAGAGEKGTIDPTQPCGISADGRYVAFASTATNLVANDTNHASDVFRRDRTAGITIRVSESTAGVQGNSVSDWPSMTDDGVEVAFESAANSLVTGDTNGTFDVFVHNTDGAVTTRVSVTNGGAESFGGDATEPQISGNGWDVVFRSAANDLTADDTESTADIFVRELFANTTELESVSSNGTQSNGDNENPSISDDGHFVTFSSHATDLYPIDANANFDAFRRDRQLDRTDLISRTASSTTGNSYSGVGATVSDDGTVAAFTSASTDLVRNDTNAMWDAFARDFATEIAPFGSFDALITQQIKDFLGRSPIASELTEWHARLLNGEFTPDGTILALANSYPWSINRGPLTRLYWAFFLRVPDLGGLNYWLGRLNSGTPLAGAAAQFAGSSEFVNTYGSLSNSAFVTKIYQHVFNRNPDAGGLAYWTGKLDAHALTRGDVMVGFSESSEGKRVLEPPVDIVLVYLGMTRAMPTQSGVQSLITFMANGGAIEQVIEGVRLSSPYAARVTP